MFTDIMLTAIFLVVVAIVLLQIDNRKEQKTMSTSLTQLDAALAAQTTEIASLTSILTQYNSDVNALVTKLQSGQDYTNELNVVTANSTAVQNAVSSLQSADTQTQAILNPPAASPSPAESPAPSPIGDGGSSETATSASGSAS